MTVSPEQQRIRERVLALVEVLDARRQDQRLDLSQIDGAFYLAVIERNLVDLVFGIDRNADQHEVIHLLMAEHYTKKEIDDTAEWLRALRALCPPI